MQICKNFCSPFVSLCGFPFYRMFRQGMHDLKVWPGVEGDGGENTTTPGRTSSTLAEDQMGRLAKVRRAMYMNNNGQWGSICVFVHKPIKLLCLCKKREKGIVCTCACVRACECVCACACVRDVRTYFNCCLFQGPDLELLSDVSIKGQECWMSMIVCL